MFVWTQQPGNEPIQTNLEDSVQTICFGYSLRQNLQDIWDFSALFNFPANDKEFS